MRTLLAALVFVSTAAHAYDLNHDSAGANPIWKSPIHFVVDRDLSAKLGADGSSAAVDAALTTIRAAVPRLTIDSAPGVPHGVGYDFANPTQSTSDVLVPDEWKWDADAVAITIISVSLSTHEIIEADVAFNAHHTTFAVIGGSDGANGYDVQNAMTHELGHTLGLAHNPNQPDSLMYPHSVPGEISKRTLVADDRAGLNFLYAAAAAASVAPVGGCSATGSAPFALLAVGLLVLARRRREVIALAAVLGTLAFVVPAFASQATSTPWSVTAVHTLAPGAGPSVLESEVTVVRAGVTRTVRMAGGRWGDVEQIVEGVAVPTEGESLTLAP